MSRSSWESVRRSVTCGTARLRPMRISLKAFFVGQLLSMGTFDALNVYEFLREPYCNDCYYPRGVPFTFFRDSGYAQRGGMVWNGFVENVLVEVLVGLIFGVVIHQMFAARKRNAPIRTLPGGGDSQLGSPYMSSCSSLHQLTPLRMMVSRAGLEPATTALKVRCSTN